jgi:hypothetical protein
MKLAEGLLLRADLQKKLASLRERIVANAVVQDGEKPQEDPKKLLSEAAAVQDELEALVERIHRTNLTTKLPDGRTLTAALARRDTLIARHALLVAAIAGARKEPDRYSAREIKWVSTLDVAKLQKQADDLAKQLRDLNGQVQQANWKKDLVD